jgi:hypothetical protein
MRLKNIIVFMMISMSKGVFSQSYSIEQLLCAADARTSIGIQQVDVDNKPVPFDCDNIKVVIEGLDYKQEILPGKHGHCPEQVYGFSDRTDFKSLPVTVMNGNQGIYKVTVSRFDDVKIFKDVVIEPDETGCHMKGQLLKVQFDMAQQAKKQ